MILDACVLMVTTISTLLTTSAWRDQTPSSRLNTSVSRYVMKKLNVAFEGKCSK